MLKAPLGVYSVLGNHDHLGGSALSLRWLSKSGQDLHHKVTSIERAGKRLWFAGGGDLWEDHVGLDGLLGTIPRQDRRIVLAHNPDSADTIFSQRVDLFISGHTHDGHVNIPFYGAPVVPSQNKT